MSILENPSAGWAFYVIHNASGRILAVSNSVEWCEWFVVSQAGA